MNVAEFVGGPSWCSRFMRRNRLSVRSRTTVGQKLLENWEEKVRNFHQFVSRRKEELAIQADRVFNMDEVPMSFDAPYAKVLLFISKLQLICFDFHLLPPKKHSPQLSLNLKNGGLQRSINQITFCCSAF